MTYNFIENNSALGVAIARSRSWMIVIGIVMIIAGAAAISFPPLSSIGVVVSVGVMLVVVGLAQVAISFGFSKWQLVALNLIIGALWVVSGIYLLAHPLAGLMVMTIIVAAAFIAEGVLKTLIAFQIRPLSGWGWALFDGIIALVLGAMLIAQFPFSALWALGLLAGINILVSGLSMVMTAFTIGKVFGQSRR